MGEQENGVTELQKAAMLDNIVRAYCIGKITAEEAIISLSKSRRCLRKKLYRKEMLSPPKPIKLPEHLIEVCEDILNGKTEGECDETSQ